MNKKILIIGIFVCIMLLIPTVNANNNIKIDTSNQVIEKPKIEPSESSEIKYARIGGSCNSLEVKGKSFEIFRNYIVFGDITIWAGAMATIIHIDGYKGSPNNYVYFSDYTNYVHAPRFIGIFNGGPGLYNGINGFAFGYIEWK